MSVPDTEITPDQSLRYIYFYWPVCLIPKLLLFRVSVAKITIDYRVRSKLLLTRVSDTYFSWWVCLIPKLLLIRVSVANITIDYRVRSKLLLTRVSDTYISLDQRSRYRNYSWSGFLVQTLLLIIGSDQNYPWPESPIPMFLLIRVPDTEEITPDQSLWYIYFSWSVCLIPKLLLIRVSGANITIDYRVRSKLLLTRVSDTYFSWWVCLIPKLLLIRVSVANITIDYRVRSKLLLTRVSDTYISLDQRSRYRNYSWSGFLVQILLLIIGSDQN